MDPATNILPLIWPAPPEAKPARATLASTRARTSACSARRVTRRSVPRKARHATRLRTPAETVALVLTLLAHGCPLHAIVVAFGFDERTVAAWGPAPGDRGRLSRSIWWNNHATWDRSKPMRSA